MKNLIIFTIIILQAAMFAELFITFIFTIFSILATTFLTSFLMKFYWEHTNKKHLITGKTPYYKDPIPYFIFIILSFIISIGLFFCLCLIYIKLFPNYCDVTCARQSLFSIIM